MKGRNKTTVYRQYGSVYRKYQKKMPHEPEDITNLVFVLVIIFKSFLIPYFPDGSGGKESACNAGDTGAAGSISWSGRCPGGGHGNPLQYSCLENPIDRGAWQATIQRVTKSGHN